MKASKARGGQRPDLQSARAELAERLRARMPEIEQAALIRLYGVSTAPERPDLDYAEGLRVGASAALAYLLAGVEVGEASALRPPPAVLVQARLAARNRVGLDTVLRRCFAGHSLFCDFLMGELERAGPIAPELPKRLLRTQAILLDRLLAVVSEEYSREADARQVSSEQRRGQLVERLLAGEPVETSELSYELDAHHVAAVAKGPGAAGALRELAGDLDRRLLSLSREDGVLWAWLGGRGPFDPELLLRRASAVLPPQVCLALGEPGKGAGGWQLSHRQALAAMPVALRGPDPVVRYGEVALLASMLKDDLLATSLRHIYMAPLARERDGGETFRKTLRAYFAAGRNVSSAAAVLGISRQAANNRLRVIEETLGRPLRFCAVELEAALRMEEFFPNRL